MKLDGPFPERPNRILRTYAGHHDSFIRVSFVEENDLRYQQDREVDGPEFIGRWVSPILKNGFTIAGTSSEQVGFNRSIDAEVVSGITARVRELLPALAGQRPIAVWAGFRPAADSAGPVIQRAGDSRLWLAYGHYRNGILLAPVTAERVSREIAGGHATQHGK